MKRLICLLFFVALAAAPVFSQKKQDIVVTIGQTNVFSNDFRKIYERNNGNITDPAEKKSPEEYLDLYVNFKLKVLEAQAMGLDTMQAFREELAGYRDELAAPYLTDISYNEQLLQATYRRLKLEVHASHLLISFPQNPSPEDTLQVWNRIREIRSEIENGLEFHEAALKYSQDPSVSQNRGNLGWFTVFQMVTPFEDAAYATPVGHISQPVRTRFGYHLLKVHDQREAKGEIKVAHIMKMFPQDVTPEDKASLRKTTDSLHALLKNGADFATLARNHSDDQRSAANGGEMPFFGRSRMIPEFSDPAFALAHDGDISEPVETDFGFHIIKRIELLPVPEFDQVRRELDERIRRDPERSTQSREIFIRKLKQDYQFARNQETVDRLTDQMASWYSDGILQVPREAPGSEALFSLDGVDFASTEWFEFMKKIPVSAGTDISAMIAELYAHWEEDAVVGYEDARLEQKYPEFKSLVNEYHDGLLLFAVSERNIWQKASQDTAGLVAFYETNKQKYIWDERFRGMIVRCANPDVKNQVEDLLEQGIPLDEIMDITQLDDTNITVEEGAWSRGDHAVVDYYVWDGTLPDGWQSETGFVRGERKIREPKLLEEAKGFHMSDYQQYLEENWLRELRRKYPVKINRKVLKRIKNA